MSDSHLTNGHHVMAVVADGRQAGDKLVVRYAKVVEQLAIGQIPDQQRKGLLRLITANADFTVGRGEQTVEEPILAGFEGGLEILLRKGLVPRERECVVFPYPGTEVDHVDIHSVA